MTITQLTKQSSTTKEEFIALVEFKGQEVPFRVTKTTSICDRGTCFTAVATKKVHNSYGDLPNMTKGQKAKINLLIQEKLNVL